MPNCRARCRSPGPASCPPRFRGPVEPTATWTRNDHAHRVVVARRPAKVRGEHGRGDPVGAAGDGVSLPKCRDRGSCRQLKDDPVVHHADRSASLSRLIAPRSTATVFGHWRMPVLCTTEPAGFRATVRSRAAPGRALDESFSGGRSCQFCSQAVACGRTEVLGTKFSALPGRVISCRSSRRLSSIVRPGGRAFERVVARSWPKADALWGLVDPEK